MITIIGAGKVGGDAALFSALRKLDDQILLVDIAKGLPQGEAMDTNHTLAELGIDVDVRGSNDYFDMANSNIVVIVAGAGRKPGMTRMDLLKINAGIMKDVVGNIKKYAPDAILVPVTNPVDAIVHIVHKESGFERNRIIGMGGMLDLSRFREFIHEATGYSRDSIRGLVIGEHGENMLPLVRYSSISGIPLEKLIEKSKLDEIIESTKKVAAKVISLKGATVHAPGNAISALVESIVRNKKQLIPVSTPLEGEYGYSGIALGVPAIIGKNGIEKIIELDLDDSERKIMDEAAKNVKSAISGI